MEKLCVLWKRLLSYRKWDWAFSDYPIQVVEQDAATPNVPRYRAAIVKWLLMGFGETKQEALDDLRKNFDKFLRDKPKEVPRPGMMMPIESYLASHDEIDKHFETAKKFTELVLDFKPGSPFFISDESSLSDFKDSEKDPIDYVSQTREVFGVDISDIEDGNLLRIFERIDGTDLDPSHNQE